MEILINALKKAWYYISGVPLFIVILFALFVLWLAEIAERAYWYKYGRLQMKNTDGHHVTVNGRCYTK